MRLSPSDAARLFKIHRATLYRHMASGRLSWGLEPSGSRELELSELIRCYGEPPRDVTLAATEATPSDHENATPATERLLAELVELARRQGEEVRLLREEVASLRRLPPPENYQDAPKENQTQIEADDPHGFRAIVRKIYANDDQGKSN